MSNNISKDNIMKVFHPVLASQNNLYALAYGIAAELEALYAENKYLEIYPSISTLPEELLDILAEDFKCDWYLQDGTVESKRAQIATCIQVHRFLGTKAAMLYALGAVCPGTEITEWFEYGGDPYYFRIICDLSEQTTPISQSIIERLANAVKPARAILEEDNIIYKLRTDIEVSDKPDYLDALNTPSVPNPPSPVTTLYYVQTGAYKVMTNADAQLAKVKAAGFDAILKKSGELYRVQVGAYSKRDNAVAMESKLKAAGFPTYITTTGGTVVSGSATDTIKVGDKVICKAGVTKYYNGVVMPSWVGIATLYVRQIEQNGKVYLVSTEPVKQVYTGRVNASDVQKI